MIQLSRFAPILSSFRKVWRLIEYIFKIIDTYKIHTTVSKLDKT